VVVVFLNYPWFSNENLGNCSHRSSLTVKLCGRQPPNLEIKTMTDNTKNTKQSRVAADCPNERLVRRFMDCPLGTRFKYKEHKVPTYVILSHYGEYGCGLVAKWDGIDGVALTQTVFSAGSSEDECRHLEIIVVA